MKRAIAAAASASDGVVDAPPGRRCIVASAISANIQVVDPARIPWIIVVAICALAAILLAVNGYTGYSITVGAVGAAAAVNLA